MKILKYLLIAIASIFSLFFLFGFIYFMAQPSPPEVITKISNAQWNLESDFSKLDSAFWTKENDLLVFNNQSLDKESVTLYSSSIPSEHKKKGYITSSVKVSGGFDSTPDNCIVGFQIGEKNAKQRDQLIMGLNGKGEIVVMNGALGSLEEEKIKIYRKGNLADSKEVTMKFHYYKNPYGWIIFFNVNNGKDGISSHINYIPFEKLNAKNKELSLIVYNPDQEGKLWFKEWNIQNDWTPND